MHIFIVLFSLWYTTSMLSLRHDGFEGEPRLHIKYKEVEAWIAQVPQPSPTQARDWQLWVRQQTGLPASTNKSPLRLAIESQLRAWLLERYHRCLFTLSFAELCKAARREAVRTSSSTH